MAFKIYKDGKLIDEAKDERTTFTPTYETEKDKPNSLFKPNEEREGLSNDN